MWPFLHRPPVKANPVPFVVGPQIGDEVPIGRRIMIRRRTSDDSLDVTLTENGRVIWTGSVDDLCYAVLRFEGGDA